MTWYIDDVGERSRYDDAQGEVLCPICEAWSPLTEWGGCRLECDLGGEHWTIDCPACGHEFQAPWADEREFEVRNVKETLP